ILLCLGAEPDAGGRKQIVLTEKSCFGRKGRWGRHAILMPLQISVLLSAFSHTSAWSSSRLGFKTANKVAAGGIPRCFRPVATPSNTRLLCLPLHSPPSGTPVWSETSNFRNCGPTGHGPWGQLRSCGPPKFKAQFSG